MKFFSSVRRQVRGDRMRSGIDKTIREFKNILLVRGMDIRMEGERLKADYYYYNLFYTITSASIISLLSLIGLIGTFAPFASGFILPTINATAVYLTAFFVNIFFLGLLRVFTNSCVKQY